MSLSTPSPPLPTILGAPPPPPTFGQQTQAQQKPKKASMQPTFIGAQAQPQGDIGTKTLLGQ